MSDGAQHVVVLGTGAGGLIAARALSKTHAVTVVDPRCIYEFTPSSVDAVVQPTAEAAAARVESISIPLSKALHGSAPFAPESPAAPGSPRFLRGTAVAIDDAARTVSVSISASISASATAGAESEAVTLPFAHLVIAVGARYAADAGFWYADPSEDIAGRIAAAEAWRARIAAASRVLVVGAGTVGVETATDIATEFPGVEVVVAHSRALPLTDNAAASARAKVAAWFENQPNARLITGSRAVEIDPETKTETETGTGTAAAATRRFRVGEEIIEADTVLVATGARPNTEFIRTSHPAALDAAGRVIVDDDLSVRGMADGIFCIGDANNVSEEKMFKTANDQAQYVTARIAAGAGAPAKPYVPGKFINNVSLGKSAALLQLGSCTILSGWTWRGSGIASFVKRQIETKCIKDLQA